MSAALEKKKKLKVKGSFTGSVTEDLLLSASGGFKAKKKIKTKELFVSSEAGEQLGTFVAGDGKKPVWTYALNNTSPAVQGLAAGETVTETYQVKFKAKGGKATGDVVITVAGANDAPTLTKNGGKALAASVSEGHVGPITTLTAADVDHGAHLSYSLAGGADAARFNINSATGALSFKASPNFENPTDSGANNSYAVIVRVSDGSLADSQTVTVNVTNVNEAPVITSNGGGSSATLSVAENGTAVTTVTASDPDAGASRSFSISGGADAAKFQIDAATGALRFVTAPNFENPTDSGANNSYVVIVRVSDGSLTDTQTITVNVTNVNEGPNTAPVITSHGGDQSVVIGIPENTTAVTTVHADDAEHDAVTYTKSGADAAYFSLDAHTGVLSFVTPPDYENAGHSANYFVTVIASDGSLTADQDFLVTVADVNESGRTVIDLTTLTAAQGFVIRPDGFSDRAGNGVGLGDVNGDGFADVIVGARFGYDGGADAGETYVIFGKSGSFGSLVGGRAEIDLTNDNPGTDGFGSGDGFIIQGDAFADRLGSGAASAGDVNGDGFEDIVAGAYLGDDRANASGEAYVVFGKASGFGTNDGAGRAVIDLSNDGVGDGFGAADGFVVQGTTINEQAGFSVSAAGDINGDGFGDIIVGAPRADTGGTDSGAAFVIFGKASGFGTVDGAGRGVFATDTLNPADGFVIVGGVGGDFAGKSVSRAGDINGDGIDDLLVGAPNNGSGGGGAGEAYVIFGKTGVFGSLDGAGRRVVDISNDDPGDGFGAADGFLIRGDDVGDQAGFSLAAVGDVNGDGFADILVGAFAGDTPDLASVGEAYLVFGSASGFGTVDPTTGRAVLDLTTFTASRGFIVRGEGVSDHLSESVSSAGDFNGDGFADLLISSTQAGASSQGEIFVIFGKSSGFGTVDGGGAAVIDAGTLNPSQGIVLAHGSTSSLMKVAGGRDINGDGFDDVIIGTPYGSVGAYVVFGGALGASATPIVATGGTGDDRLMGALGNDTLSGGGGLDVFHAGKGNDTITVPDLGFRLIDGGNGTDKLVLTGSGATFDFTALADTRVQGIEAIDFTGTGNNTLKLGLRDALKLSDNPHAGFTGSVAAPKAIVIEGDAGDTLRLASDPRGTWTRQAEDVKLDGSAGGTYDVWSMQTGAHHLIKLAVDADVAVLLI